MRASLFLIPVTLGDTEHRRVLPEYNRDVILSIRHFIVENVRTARRFLKKVEPGIVIDDLTFYELNKHTSPEQVIGGKDLFRASDAIVYRDSLPE